MGQWRDRFDGLSYALRFESNRPEGDSPSVKLANQAFNALKDHNPESNMIRMISQTRVQARIRST